MAKYEQASTAAKMHLPYSSFLIKQEGNDTLLQPKIQETS